MVIYTDKYTESDKRIQNNNLLYKIHQQSQNIFEIFYFSNISETIYQKTSIFYFSICINSIIHILYILYIAYILNVLYIWPLHSLSLLSLFSSPDLFILAICLPVRALGLYSRCMRSLYSGPSPPSAGSCFV